MIKRIKNGSIEIFFTQKSWEMFRESPDYITRILDAGSLYKSRIEDFNVYFISQGNEENRIDAYVKEVDLRLRPDEEGYFEEGKSVVREFKNYMRLKKFRKSLPKHKRRKIEIAEPLFAYIDEDSGKSYISTVSVEKCVTLEEILNVKRFEPKYKIKFLRRAENALKILHEHGFLYRDPNPGNILFDRTKPYKTIFIDPEFLVHKYDIYTVKEILKNKTFEERAGEEIEQFRRESRYNEILLSYKAQLEKERKKRKREGK